MPAERYYLPACYPAIWAPPAREPSNYKDTGFRCAKQMYCHKTLVYRCKANETQTLRHKARRKDDMSNEILFLLESEKDGPMISIGFRGLIYRMQRTGYFHDFARQSTRQNSGHALLTRPIRLDPTPLDTLTQPQSRAKSLIPC